MVTRRQRGRPPRDYRDDPDLEVAEWAIALQSAWTLSERKSIDLALANCQGGLLNERGFSSRNADIRRKLKAGRIKPNPVVVRRIVRQLMEARRLVREYKKKSRVRRKPR